MQNSQLKDALTKLLDADSLSESTHEELIEMVLSSKEAQELKNTLKLSAVAGLNKLSNLVKGKTKEELEMLLLAPLEYLEIIYSI